MSEPKYVFKKLGFASDHAGAVLKAELLVFVRELGFSPVDYGVASESASVDYPDYASLLAQDVASKKLDAGIAVCGTGIGMSIVANKFSGIRAVCAWDEYSSRMSRAHNNSNVLCLGGRLLTPFRAKTLLEIWLSTPFSGEQHKKRIEKIDKIEKKFFNPSEK